MTRFIPVLASAFLLVACGSSTGPENETTGGSGGGLGGGGDNPGGVTNAACDPNNATMPGSPPVGDSRTGLNCAIFIPSPINPAEQIAFQVFEPSLLTGGDRYPIILDGHGFSGSRKTSADGGNVPGLSFGISNYLDNGYGVVSIDQAGHGETGGLIKVMDPDQEGIFLIAILNWIDENIDWYATGPDLDAGEDNILLGASGPSYGGGYQLLIHAVDPLKRIDAIVPQITWNNLNYSLNPEGVIKAAWDVALFSLGNTAGGGGNFDPFVTQTFQDGLTNNVIDEFGEDYFRYHSLSYFCGNEQIATNGGPGTTPLFAPNNPTAVHALFFQGFRDVLFNFTEAYRNYQCLAGLGADVRLYSYQSGHNTIPVVADVAASQPPDNSTIQSCGAIDAAGASLAWFNEHLKGQVGAFDAYLDTVEPAMSADAAEREICLSLSGTDAIMVPEILDGVAGTEFAVENVIQVGPQEVTVPISVQVGTPLQVPLSLYTAPAEGDILAGIPRVEISISDTGNTGNPPENTIIFVAVGHMLATSPGTWEVMDNMVLPFRGLGQFDVDLIGVAERLAPGDQVGLLFYGSYEPQFPTTGSRPTAPFAPVVEVTGTAWLPLLGTP